MLNSRMTLTSKNWLIGAGIVSVVVIASTLFSLEHDWHLFSITTLMVGGSMLFANARQSLASVIERPQEVNRQYLLNKLQQVDQRIAKLADQGKRQTLSEQVQQITSNLQKNHFRIVVFGMGAAGKTSLVNVLLGSKVGKTAAEIGTSDRQEYSYRDVINPLAGFNFINSAKDSKLKRQVSLIDTSGLQEMGAIGQQREKEAIELAQVADLLVFVTVGDLTSIEYRELTNLARLGKRIILAFNKTDLYLPSDRATILAKLKASTCEFLVEQDIVAIAAQPSPIKVRQADPVGGETMQEWWENIPPDVSQLKDRIESILSYEWEELLIHNTELQIENLLQQVNSSINAERRQAAKIVIERYQVIAATTVFANPIPALDLLAGAAINTQMLIDLGKIYECPISFKQSQQFAITIAKQLVQLGCVEIATSAIASCLKVNALTYAIGGFLQAATAAYLTHIGGNSFLTYLEQNPQLATERNSKSADNLLVLQKISQRTFQALQSDRFVMDFVSNVSQRLSHQLAEYSIRQQDREPLVD